MAGPSAGLRDVARSRRRGIAGASRHSAKIQIDVAGSKTPSARRRSSCCTASEPEIRNTPTSAGAEDARPKPAVGAAVPIQWWWERWRLDRTYKAEWQTLRRDCTRVTFTSAI